MHGQFEDNVVILNGSYSESREQVLERLFNEHSFALRGFLRVCLETDADVEDAVQEVFIRLAGLDRLSERLPPDKKSNQSFLLAMANNLVVDMSRRKGVRRRYAEARMAEAREDVGSTHDSPEAIALAGKDLEQVKSVIMGLPSGWRQAFILNRFKYKSYRQIAQEMNISVKTVEKYIKKALTRIRAEVFDSKGEGTS